MNPTLNICSLEPYIVRCCFTGKLNKRGFSVAFVGSGVFLNAPCEMLAVPVGHN